MPIPGIPPSRGMLTAWHPMTPIGAGVPGEMRGHWPGTGSYPEAGAPRDLSTLSLAHWRTLLDVLATGLGVTFPPSVLAVVGVADTRTPRQVWGRDTFPDSIAAEISAALLPALTARGATLDHLWQVLVALDFDGTALRNFLYSLPGPGGSASPAPPTGSGPPMGSQSQIVEEYEPEGAEPPPETTSEGLPWGWIAAGVGGLLALGAAVYFAGRTGKRSSSTTRRRKNPRALPRRANPKGLKWQAGTNYGEIRARHKKSKTLYEVTNFGEGLLSVYEPGQRATTVQGHGIGSLVRMAEADRPGRRTHKNPKKAGRKPTKYERGRARAKKAWQTRRASEAWAADAARQSKARPKRKNLAATTRARMPGAAFALPERRAYPIGSHKQAKRALSFSRLHPKDAPRVRAAVFRRFPDLRRS